MGPSKQAKDAYSRQNQLTTTSQDLGKSLIGGANTAFGQRSSLLQKPIDFYSGIASGDPNKMLEAAAPGLTNISKGAQSAIEGIQDSTAPGAARNFAIAQIQRDKFGQNAQLLNQAFLSSFPALQQIGTDTGNFGLQQLGGAINSNQQATQGNQNIINAEAQRRQAKLNTVGGLVGAAAGPLAGGLSGLGGTGSAGASPIASLPMYVPGISTPR